MKDYLIIGQGVAGSFLAWELMKRDKSVEVIDDHHLGSSSMVSTGIVNPITGKRFALTPGFDKFYIRAREAYAELEEFFGEPFLVDKPIVRLFKNTEEAGKWERKDKRGIAEAYVTQYNPPGTYQSVMEDTLGSIETTNSGFCWTQALLFAFRDYFFDRKVLFTRKFSHSALHVFEDHVEYGGVSYCKIIFCEGYQGQSNPWFRWLPFNPVKGELLRFKMTGENLPDAVLNRGKWCAPLGNGVWSAGATYCWDPLDCQPTDQGREEILEGLKAFLHEDIEVIGHKAGVRPVMKDQRAVLGLHPQTVSVGIFNGLGSKGFLMAPYYALQLAEHLEDGMPIDGDAAVARFWMEG